MVVHVALYGGEHDGSPICAFAPFEVQFHLFETSLCALRRGDELGQEQFPALEQISHFIERGDQKFVDDGKRFRVPLKVPPLPRGRGAGPFSIQ